MSDILTPADVTIRGTLTDSEYTALEDFLLVAYERHDPRLAELLDAIAGALADHEVVAYALPARTPARIPLLAHPVDPEHSSAGYYASAEKSFRKALDALPSDDTASAVAHLRNVRTALATVHAIEPTVDEIMTLTAHLAAE